MSATPLVRLEREGKVGVVVVDNPPVNATSHGVRRGLLDAVNEIAAGDCAAGVILGAGRTFIAGADIREFDFPPEPPHLPEVIEAMMGSRKPFVAAMHGWALGGGFEVALGCDLRIAAPGTLVGLPETTLGMMPGAGGTQHVPRLVGISRAIGIICSGRRIRLEEALELGLVDRLVEGNLRVAAVAMAEGTPKRPLRDLRVPAEDEGAITSAAEEAIAGYPAAHIRAAIEAIRASAWRPYAEALAHEREVFLRLRASPESAALRARFFASRGQK